MKRSLLALMVLCGGSGFSYAGSNLPPCPTDYSLPFNNCFGTWTDGQFTYTGEWQNDKQEGWGQSVSSVGDSYVGEFKAGKRNGQGTFTTSSGERFVGEFVDDALTGKATHYDSAGNVIDSGLFANNILIRSDIPKTVAAEQGNSIRQGSSDSDGGSNEAGQQQRLDAAGGTIDAPVDGGSCSERPERSNTANTVLRATGFLLGGDNGWAAINGSNCRIVNKCIVEYQGAISTEQVSAEANPLAQMFLGGQLKLGTRHVVLDWNKVFWASAATYGTEGVPREIQINCSGDCMVKSGLKGSMFVPEGEDDQVNDMFGAMMDPSPRDRIILPLVATVDRMERALKDIQSVCEGKESAY